LERERLAYTHLIGAGNFADAEVSVVAKRTLQSFLRNKKQDCN
jgi:23S rRNA A2030 N6-methylase RlmJ